MDYPSSYCSPAWVRRTIRHNYSGYRVTHNMGRGRHNWRLWTACNAVRYQKGSQSKGTEEGSVNFEAVALVHSSAELPFDAANQA